MQLKRKLESGKKNCMKKYYEIGKLVIMTEIKNLHDTALHSGVKTVWGVNVHY